MMKIKHFLDAIEPDDGQRLWVEPIGLTLELQEWCQINQVASHLGPNLKLWRWFEKHPDGYDYFRGKYHEALAKGSNSEALRQLVQAASKQNVTLIYEGSDPQHNTAVALYEFLSELEAWCPPETL